MVRAVDQLLDNGVTTIDHLYKTTAATSPTDELANMYRVTFDQEVNLDTLMEDLKKNIAIEFVEKEPLYKVTYTDPQAVQQWHLHTVQADSARYAGASGNSSVVIAVIDNGFDLSHADLQ